MKIKGVICDGCGSELRVESNASTLTCTICSSDLHVEKSGSHFYTTLLEDGVLYKRPVEEELNLKLPGEKDKLKLNRKERQASAKKTNQPKKSKLYLRLLQYLFVIFLALTFMSVVFNNNIFYLLVGAFMSIYNYFEILNIRKYKDKSS